MVIPADREGRDTGNVLLQRGRGRGEDNDKPTSTRKAGGATKQEETRPIVSAYRNLTNFFHLNIIWTFIIVV